MKRNKIFGPPGTGKTFQLLKLMEEYKNDLKLRPSEIGFISFTRAGREEALRRLGGEAAKWPYVKTLHSICYKAINASNGSMVNRDTLQLFSEIVNIPISSEPNIDDDEPWSELPLGDQLLRVNHLGRHRQIGLRAALAELKLDVNDELAAFFTRSYREWKDREGLYDFTDLLTEYLKRGSSLPVQALIVDEAQDLSPLQWSVAEKMAVNCSNFTVAGDDDQAIFTWAGATAANFNEWHANNGVVVLEQSFRLPKSVHEFARHITDAIQLRTTKRFNHRNAEGQVNFAGTFEDCGVVPGETTLILYRHKSQGKRWAKYLKVNGIPFSGILSPLDRPVTKLAIDFVKGINNKETRNAYAYLGGNVNKPADLDSLHKMWDFNYVTEVGLQTPSVQLMSIHQSKGQEANHVVLDTDMSRAAWEHLQTDPDDEHRVWYVGATRAKEKLTILDGMGNFKYEVIQ